MRSDDDSARASESPHSAISFRPASNCFWIAPNEPKIRSCSKTSKLLRGGRFAAVHDLFLRRIKRADRVVRFPLFIGERFAERVVRRRSPVEQKPDARIGVGIRREIAAGL
jgi:hypothetical protein